MLGLCCGALSTDARGNVRSPAQAPRFLGLGGSLWHYHSNAQRTAVGAQPPCRAVSKAVNLSLMLQPLPGHA